jgi:hypothetical protein
VATLRVSSCVFGKVREAALTSRSLLFRMSDLLGEPHKLTADLREDLCCLLTI